MPDHYDRYLMVIIVFPDGTDWYRPNWIFRQLAEDTMRAFPQDDALRLNLEVGQSHGALFLNRMEPDVANATIKAIKWVVEETVQDRIQGWKQARPEDKDGHRMYAESMEELLNILRQQTGELPG